MALVKNIGTFSLVVAVVSVVLASDCIAETKSASAAKPKASTKAKPTKSAATAKATPAVTEKVAAYTGPPVMDPSRFYGAAAMGYAAAKAVPDVVSKLFCYCGCDISDNHSYLIDCFTGTHGVDCHICQEEAVLALRMHRDGASLVEIQKKVDEEYSKQYPFQEDSPTYKKYKASRLWTKADAAASKAPAGPEPAKDWKPVVKPGMSPSECCSNDHKK